MKFIYKNCLFVTAALFVCLTAFAATAEEVNVRGNNALQLYSQGKVEEGLAELKATVAMDPGAANWHMNYGSLLFDQSRVYFYREGKTAHTVSLASEAQVELQTAVKLFSKNESDPAAQCHFLLGDIASFMFGDDAEAVKEYRKALDLNPNHQDAIAAMIRLEGKTQEKMTPAQLEAAKQPSTIRASIPASPPPAPTPKKVSTVLHDHIVLANGQSMNANIVEKTVNGMWVELDPGTKIFLSNSEVKSAEKRKAA